MVQICLGRNFFLGELSDAAQFAFGIFESHLDFIEPAAGSGQLRFGQVQTRLHVGRVNPGEHFSGFDAHPFFDQDLDHLSGDLRGHGRRPARGHVTRSVQQDFLSARGCFVRRDRPHGDCLRMFEPPECAGGERDERDNDHDQPRICPAGWRRCAVNA